MLRINKGLKINYVIFYFFLISIFSWFLEILYSLVFRYKLVKPGSFFGPWCPVYGVTACILLILINKNSKKWVNFIKMYLISSIIEYFASFICDVLFHKTIWDYSEFFLNINGRICLVMSLVFAIMCYIMIYYIEPVINNFYIKHKEKINKINIILLIIFIIDVISKIISKNI